MKTLIAVPCMDQVASQFAQSLATLNKEGECLISFLQGSLIYDSRNKLAHQAIASGADYVLWLDSDMVFAPDTLTRLLEHLRNGKDIISGVYFRRTLPYTPVIFKELTPERDTGYDDYPDNDVFTVAGAGFGCIAMKTEVLIKMALCEGNWFTPEGKYGEDLSFCLRAKRCGYDIWCDSKIKCGHIGHAIITEEVYKMIGEPKCSTK